jgi:hypothetical protein
LILKPANFWKIIWYIADELYYILFIVFVWLDLIKKHDIFHNLWSVFTRQDEPDICPRQEQRQTENAKWTGTGRPKRLMRSLYQLSLFSKFGIKA